MGVDKQALDIIRSAKDNNQDKILDIIRSAKEPKQSEAIKIIRDAATGPSAVQESGGGIRPDSATAPVTTPSQPSRFERFQEFVNRQFRDQPIVGQPHPAVAEQFSKAGLPIPASPFSVEDTEMMDSLFQDQQQFGLILFEAADYLDKPRRVGTNLMEFQNRQLPMLAGAPSPLGILSNVLIGKGTPRFESAEDAVRKGWSGEESVSLLKAGEVGVLGGEVSDRIQAWEDRHWPLRYSRKVGDVVSNLAADAALDLSIGKAVVTPIRKGLLKYGTEGMQNAIKRMGKDALDEGFEAVAARAANDAANLQTTARKSTDDMIRESIENSGVVPEVPLAMQATADDVAKVQAALVTKRIKAQRLTQKITDLDNQIKSLNTESSSLARAQADYDKFVMETRKNLLVDQVAEVHKDTAATRSILTEMQNKAHAIDYKASSRDLRAAYINTHILKLDDPEAAGSIRHFIRLASGNTTDDIAEMTDEGFDALFDFIDAKAKDPSNWAYLSTEVPGNAGRIRRLGRAFFNNQVVSPSWQVFDRLNAGRLYQFVDDAFFNRYEHVARIRAEWDFHLENIGVSVSRKQRSKKEKDILRRVFLVADGRMTKLEDGVASFNVTATRTAKETWITPVSKEELAAAQYANKEARVFANMAVAQGRLSHTGKDAPKVIDHYMTHLFDRQVVESQLDVDSAKQLAKEMREAADAIPDATLKQQALDAAAEIEKAAQSGAKADLARIADIYQFQTATDVDIPQFLRRVNARQGLIEDADLAFRTMADRESHALYMQPAYQQATGMANATENDNLIRYTRQWINDMRGIPGKAEATLEPNMHDFSLMLEHGTRWLPDWTHLKWKAEDRAIRQMSKWFRSKTYFAAMGFNPGPIVTNMTQSTLTIGAIGVKPTLAGMQSLSTEGGRNILRHSRILIGRNPMHSIGLKEMSRISRAGNWGFRMIDKWMNVAPAFNGSLYKQIHGNADKMAILRKYGIPEGNGFWTSLSKALDAGEFAPESNIANRIAKLTQYSYLKHDTPQFLRGPFGSMFGQFLSWPANYWQSYIPEMAKWMVTGQSPFGPLSATERGTLVRHILLAETLIAAGGDMGIDLKKHRPVTLGGNVAGIPIFLPGGAAPRETPALKILTGAAQVFTSQGDQRKIDKGLGTIRSGFMMKRTGIPIPFYPQAFNRLEKAAEEDNIGEIFFKLSDEDKSSFKSRFRIRPPGAPTPRRPSLF